MEIILNEVINLVKQAVLNMVNDLPENTTFDEVMYRLYILSNHEKAMRDIEEGRTYTTEEVRQFLAQKSVINK